MILKKECYQSLSNLTLITNASKSKKEGLFKRKSLLMVLLLLISYRNPKNKNKPNFRTPTHPSRMVLPLLEKNSSLLLKSKIPLYKINNKKNAISKTQDIKIQIQSQYRAFNLKFWSLDQQLNGQIQQVQDLPKRPSMK